MFNTYEIIPFHIFYADRSSFTEIYFMNMQELNSLIIHYVYVTNESYTKQSHYAFLNESSVPSLCAESYIYL